MKKQINILTAASSITSLTIWVMMLSLAFPTAAFAYVPNPTTGQTWNLTAATNDGNGAGWTWVQNTRTLTLTNFAFETHGVNYGVLLPASSTIVLVGTNTIKNNRDNIIFGIYINGNLTIRGTGSLTVTVDGTGANYDNSAIGISGMHTLTIESGTVVADALTTQGGNTGIRAYTTVINSGTVTATGGNTTAFGHNSFGIMFIDNITINGGTVTAIGSTSAINHDYAVPIGYYYRTSENSPQIKSEGRQEDKIGSEHKWAWISSFGTAPPTGLPDLTAATMWMWIFIALSLVLWGYVGWNYYVSSRCDSRG